MSDESTCTTLKGTMWFLCRAVHGSACLGEVSAEGWKIMKLMSTQRVSRVLGLRTQ